MAFTKNMFIFAFLFVAICRASEDLDLGTFSRDLLFSLDQNIQVLSQPLHHRFEHLVVRDKARAGFITQAWQDVMGPQIKVYFPDKFDRRGIWRWQQLIAWENKNVYQWYHGMDGLFPNRMFFVGYSTLQPAHMRLHSIVVTSVQDSWEFACAKWCEKPFWSNTSTCKVASKMHLKKPGFLVNGCIRLAQEEAMTMKLRKARHDLERAIIKNGSMRSDTYF